ncbi:MAG TPA: hypothetical protein VGP93_10555 [Polyangiaceae bacterium]|jgi:hypothetical protein|nr:hypothetical protein [Polyangiaceae bacterium]
MSLRNAVCLGWCGVAGFAFACGPKHIPPGTPPPEYERPVVTPWPTGETRAADDPVPPPGSEQETAPAPVGAGEPLDGGVIDAASQPLSDAGARR